MVTSVAGPLGVMELKSTEALVATFVPLNIFLEGSEVVMTYASSRVSPKPINIKAEFGAKDNIVPLAIIF